MEQPRNNLSQAPEGAPSCPRCVQQGRSVFPTTIESLVKPAVRARLRSLEGFRFCATPACDVAYFHPATGETIICAEVRVPIFQKHSEPQSGWSVIASKTRWRRFSRKSGMPELPASLRTSKPGALKGWTIASATIPRARAVSLMCSG